MIPGERIVRGAAGLPLGVARRVFGLAGGLLSGGNDKERRREPATEDLDLQVAVDDALTRERDPVEEAAPAPDDNVAVHVDRGVEVVAESADVEAAETPAGPELHVDEPWDGYRRMKVSEITAQLEGQPPEVLAAVELYETTHRHRPGVLNAVRAASRA